MTLQEAFEQVEDHRSGPAQRYDLKEMIIIDPARRSMNYCVFSESKIHGKRERKETNAGATP